MENSTDGIGGAIMRAAERNAPNAGDYRSGDGLLVCGKCHTGKQTRIELFGEYRIVGCMCKCREAEVAAVDESERERKKTMSRRDMRRIGVCGKFWDCTFDRDNCKDERASKAARRFEELFPGMINGSIDKFGLLFHGDVGSGKTYYAACITNALIDRGYRVLMTTFGEVLNRLQDMHNGDRQRYINDITAYPLLIIDDLGAERQTEFALEQVFGVIDRRLRSGLPLIVTTNIDIEQIKNPLDLQHKRIYDRILHMCQPILVRGESRRRAEIKELFQLRNELLFGQ